MKPLFGTLAILLLALPVRAAGPRDRLLRLVPEEDIAFCLLIEDLRGHATAFLNSPFYEHVRATPLGKALLEGPEMRKLAEVEQFFQQHLGVTFAALRDDLFGDAVVFAYRPGPPGQPEREQGLILLHARDPRLLADFLARFDAAQKASGELKSLEELRHHDASYHRRVDAKETQYRYVDGSVLVMSASEEMVRQAIDRHREAGDPAAAPLPRRFARIGGPDRLARLWLNPRAFEPELRDKAASAQGTEAVSLRTLLRYWQAVDDVGLALGVGADLTLSLTVRGRREALPEAARRVFAGSPGRADLWHRFPPDAILTVAGALDVAALLDVLGGFLDDGARQALRGAVEGTLGPALSQEVLQSVLPNFGPEFGLCVAAPPAGSADWFPHVLGAVRVRPGDGAIPADVVVSGTLQAFTVLAVREHNRRHDAKLRLRATQIDGVTVTHLLSEEQFPSGVRPGFAMKDGFLVLASAPEAVRRFSPAKHAAGEAPMARLSLRALHRYLSTCRAPLIRSSAAKNQVSEEEAGRQLDQLLSALQWFDRLELGLPSQSGQWTLTLRAHPVRPLK